MVLLQKYVSEGMLEDIGGAGKTSYKVVGREYTPAENSEDQIASVETISPIHINPVHLKSKPCKILCIHGYVSMCSCVPYHNDWALLRAAFLRLSNVYNDQNYHSLISIKVRA